MNGQIDHQRHHREQFQRGNKIVCAHGPGGNLTLLNRMGEEISAPDFNKRYASHPSLTETTR